MLIPAKADINGRDSPSDSNVAEADIDGANGDVLVSSDFTAEFRLLWGGTTLEGSRVVALTAVARRDAVEEDSASLSPSSEDGRAGVPVRATSSSAIPSSLLSPSSEP